MKFKMHEGNFPLLIIRKRGPLNIPLIIQRAQNIEHFMDLLKKLILKELFRELHNEQNYNLKVIFGIFTADV